MEIFFYTILWLLWLIFWSFASVVIYRLHSGEKWILNGRSHCGKCNHPLNWKNLFPLFSFLFQKWKCSHCHEKIPFVYPLLELTMAGMFIWVGFFLSDVSLLFSFPDVHEWLNLGVQLVLAFCTVVFVFYDILYMEIPEEILLIANIVAFLYLFFLGYQSQDFSPAEIAFLTLFWGGILAWFYYIVLEEKEDTADLVLLWWLGFLFIVLSAIFGSMVLSFPLINGIVTSYIVFCFFFIQYYISSGAWIGWGDFRIAILMGLMLGLSHLMVGFFATYISGSVVWIGWVVYKYFQTNKLNQNMKIPFWPFLAFGIYFSLFFRETIKSLLNHYL